MFWRYNNIMEDFKKRIGVIGIVIKGDKIISVEIQKILNQFSDNIIGRMGIPYKERGLSVISIAIDAPLNVINGLSGKIGKLDGINVKAAYSNIAGKT